MDLVLTSDCAALAVHAARKLLLSASVGRGRAAAKGVASAAGGTRFTCFTGARVQTLTPEELQVLALFDILEQK